MLKRVFTFSIFFLCVIETSAHAEDYHFEVPPLSSLTEVSVRVYATPKYWKQIADLNHIEAPYRIDAGQILKLPMKPLLSKKEGDDQLVRVWFAKLSRRDGSQTDRKIAQEAVPPPRYYDEGEKHFSEGHFKSALTAFRKSRSAGVEVLPASIYEIRCLKELRRKEAAQSAAKDLITKFPMLESNNFIKSVLSGDY